MDSRHRGGGALMEINLPCTVILSINKGGGRNSKRGVTASEYSIQCLHTTKAQHVITHYLIAYRENQALGHMLRFSSS